MGTIPVGRPATAGRSSTVCSYACFAILKLPRSFDHPDREITKSYPDAEHVSQVRGFWLGPWLNEETPDRQATLQAGMRLIADGTVKLEPGAQSQGQGQGQH